MGEASDVLNINTSKATCRLVPALLLIVAPLHGGGHSPTASRIREPRHDLKRALHYLCSHVQTGTDSCWGRLKGSSTCLIHPRYIVLGSICSVCSVDLKGPRYGLLDAVSPSQQATSAISYLEGRTGQTKETGMFPSAGIKGSIAEKVCSGIASASRCRRMQAC